jgi:hypothetical protein
MFFRRRFLNWDEYMTRIEFLDYFNFQQKVRKENIKNL